MKQGRRPNTRQANELAGTYIDNPARDPSKKDFVAHVKGAPEMPQVVKDDPYASWYWNWAITILEEQGILTTACMPLLTLHCLDWAQAMHLYHKVKSCSVSSFDNRPTPEAIQFHKYVTRLLKELTEFGLTPASQSKVVVHQKANEDDPFVDLLKRRSMTSTN